MQALQKITTISSSYAENRDDTGSTGHGLVTGQMDQRDKTTFSGRAFRCTAPTICNSLSNIVTAADSVATSESRLKTHLFNHTFRQA